LIEEISRRAFPHARLLRSEPLEGGIRNHTVLLHLDCRPHRAVLRLYKTDASACRREVELLGRIGAFLPVPEVLAAAPDYVAPWAVFRYIEGITFRELKRARDPAATAQAARSVGETLAHFGDLVHGDFGKNNILVRFESERWRVAAIIDWELADTGGSPLIDIGHFLRYERKARPLLEPHFSEGYRDAGGVLLPEWREQARLIDLERLRRDLLKPDLPPEVFSELSELVAAILEDV
jgi:aminoglycoside phosphotransferase (APT) family kinase protein